MHEWERCMKVEFSLVREHIDGRWDFAFDELFYVASRLPVHNMKRCWRQCGRKAAFIQPSYKLQNKWRCTIKYDSTYTLHLESGAGNLYFQCMSMSGRLVGKLFDAPNTMCLPDVMCPLQIVYVEFGDRINLVLVVFEIFWRYQNEPLELRFQILNCDYTLPCR